MATLGVASVQASVWREGHRKPNTCDADSLCQMAKANITLGVICRGAQSMNAQIFQCTVFRSVLFCAFAEGKIGLSCMYGEIGGKRYKEHASCHTDLFCIWAL
uniref:Uncharacterized protein n=1 Tax=Pararge aegeria TaxID=116150 RepID=S4PUL5_9NEOP